MKCLGSVWRGAEAFWWDNPAGKRGDAAPQCCREGMLGDVGLRATEPAWTPGCTPIIPQHRHLISGAACFGCRQHCQMLPHQKTDTLTFPNLIFQGFSSPAECLPEALKGWRGAGWSIITETSACLLNKNLGCWRRILKILHNFSFLNEPGVMQGGTEWDCWLLC